MLWLRRCGAFLILFMICRTPAEPCARSRLWVGDCCGCGFIDKLLLPLSKMVGIAAAADCPLLLLLVPMPMPAENKFNSLAAASDVLLFDEFRRFRNDNDFKRLNLVDSLAALLLIVGGVGDDDCWCRSNNVDTNWSSTSKSAFILEFRMLFDVAVLLPSFLLFDVRPKRWASYGIDDIER